MHKKLIIAGAVLVIAVLIVVYLKPLYISGRTEAACRAAGGGWAPTFYDANSMPLGCDGKRLSKDSSLIIEGGDGAGFTCFCHAPDSCWNGKECVEIPK